MENPRRVLAWLLVAVALGYLACGTSAQDASPSGSFSASQSDSVGIEDKNPCSFRGQFLIHKQSVRLDPCTECTCNNGTTTCEIESCPPEPGCAPSEIVIIPEECCPQCPYKMFVENVNNMYEETFTFSEGQSKKIRFGLDVEVDKKLTSRFVRGTNLWKLSAWVSRNEDGSGPKYSLKENVFSEKDAAQEYMKPVYPPWQWSKLRYTMNFEGGSCADYKYFCVKFDQSDDPQPTYDLDFTFQPVDDEVERLIDCVPLGECKGLTAVDLDFDLDEREPAAYGQETGIGLDVDVSFTKQSADQSGEGLWRFALFGSGNADGSGPRFRESAQILSEGQQATSKSGLNLAINNINRNFELGTIGCTEDVQYVCVEFAQGNDPDPPFTMIIDTPTNTLIKCEERECAAKAIFSQLVPELTGDFPAIEGKTNTIRLNLDAITDKDQSTAVPGDSLWTLGTYFNARANGKGPRIKEISQILDQSQQGIDLVQDENLEFSALDFQTDLTGVVCDDIPYICFELSKNDAASLDYIFGTSPVQDPFVECQDFSKYCKGVIYNGIIWDRQIPDHTPGRPVAMTINSEIQVDPVSRPLSGRGLYEMGVFVASNEDGTGRQSVNFNQVLTPAQMSTRLPAGGPLTINGIRTPPIVTEKLGCAEFKYLCVEFRKGRSARPDYTAEFTQAEVELGSADEGVIFEDDKLISCREEKCAELDDVIRKTMKLSNLARLRQSVDC